jgi:hypothetical protein
MVRQLSTLRKIPQRFLEYLDLYLLLDLHLSLRGDFFGWLRTFWDGCGQTRTKQMSEILLTDSTVRGEWVHVRQTFRVALQWLNDW